MNDLRRTISGMPQESREYRRSEWHSPSWAFAPFHSRCSCRHRSFCSRMKSWCYRAHVPVGSGQSQKFLPLAERAATRRGGAGGAICHPTDCPGASPPLRLSTNHRGAAPSRNADQSQSSRLLWFIILARSGNRLIQSLGTKVEYLIVDYSKVLS